MRGSFRVAQPPPKPLLVFDGNCECCRRWIRRWQRLTVDAVDYLPAQDARLAKQFPEIPPTQYAAAIQLIAPDGAVFSGAEAVFRSLAHNPRQRWLIHQYETSPAFARLSEWAYRFVARHRQMFSRLTRLAGGG